MSSLLDEVIAVLTIIWWLQKLQTAVCTWAVQKFNMERFNLVKLNNAEVKEQIQVKISNRFAALENLDDDDDMDISRAWKSIRENIKASATEV